MQDSWECQRSEYYSLLESTLAQTTQQLLCDQKLTSYIQTQSFSREFVMARVKEIVTTISNSKKDQYVQSLLKDLKSVKKKSVDRQRLWDSSRDSLQQQIRKAREVILGQEKWIHGLEQREQSDLKTAEQSQSLEARLKSAEQAVVSGQKDKAEIQTLKAEVQKVLEANSRLQSELTKRNLIIKEISQSEEQLFQDNKLKDIRISDMQQQLVLLISAASNLKPNHQEELKHLQPKISANVQQHENAVLQHQYRQGNSLEDHSNITQRKGSKGDVEIGLQQMAVEDIHSYELYVQFRLLEEKYLDLEEQFQKVVVLNKETIDYNYGLGIQTDSDLPLKKTELIAQQAQPLNYVTNSLESAISFTESQLDRYVSLYAAECSRSESLQRELESQWQREELLVSRQQKCKLTAQLQIQRLDKQMRLTRLEDYRQLMQMNHKLSSQVQATAGIVLEQYSNQNRKLLLVKTSFARIRAQMVELRCETGQISSLLYRVIEELKEFANSKTILWNYKRGPQKTIEVKNQKGYINSLTDQVSPPSQTPKSENVGDSRQSLRRAFHSLRKDIDLHEQFIRDKFRPRG